MSCDEERVEQTIGRRDAKVMGYIEYVGDKGCLDLSRTDVYIEIAERDGVRISRDGQKQ